MKKKIRDHQDFEWLKQCRFYWREDRQTVVISICDVDFDYSFEYLGEPCSPRLGPTSETVACLNHRCPAVHAAHASIVGRSPAGCLQWLLLLLLLPLLGPAQPSAACTVSAAAGKE